MNDIAVTARAPLEVRRADLPTAVRRAIWQQIDPTCFGGRPTALKPADFEAAQSALAIFERNAAPASPELVLTWMESLSVGLANPPGETGMRGHATLVALACEDLPGWLFGRESLKQAARRFKFLPTGSEVFELLVQVGQEALETRRALRDLVALGPCSAPPETAPETEAEVAAMVSGLRDLREELSAGVSRSPARQSRPIPLAARIAALWEAVSAEPPGPARDLLEFRAATLERQSVSA